MRFEYTAIVPAFVRGTPRVRHRISSGVDDRRAILPLQSSLVPEEFRIRTNTVDEECVLASGVRGIQERVTDSIQKLVAFRQIGNVQVDATAERIQNDGLGACARSVSQSDVQRVWFGKGRHGSVRSRAEAVHWRGQSATSRRWWW